MTPQRPAESRLVKAALALLSIVLVLLVIEVWLRMTTPVEDLYAQLATYPELASDGWARSFVRDYAELSKRGALGSDLGGYIHDSFLGWDVPNHARAVHRPPEGEPVTLRVLTIGDSFTYGSEVEADQTFSAYLAKLMPGAEVTNMGVRAYGVGQMALKLATYGRDRDADVIIVSIFGPDYVRTPLSFYRFAMPSIELASTGRNIEVKNVPVPPPDEMFERLSAEMPPLLYSYALLRQAFLNLRPWRNLTGHEERFYCHYDIVHEILLRSAKSAADRQGAQLLLVYIPSAAELTEAQAFGVMPARASLLRIFERVGVPYLDLADALLKRHKRPGVYQDLYFHNNGLEGHFTPEGNRAVAEILRDEIVKLRAGKPPRDPRHDPSPAPEAEAPQSGTTTPVPSDRGGPSDGGAPSKGGDDSSVRSHLDLMPDTSEPGISSACGPF